jgi:hypothetical protein
MSMLHAQYMLRVWLSWLNFSKISLSCHFLLAIFWQNKSLFVISYRRNIRFGEISFRRNFVSGGRSPCEDFYSEQLRHISFRVASFE